MKFWHHDGLYGLYFKFSQQKLRDFLSSFHIFLHKHNATISFGVVQMGDFGGARVVLKLLYKVVLSKIYQCLEYKGFLSQF